MAPNGTIGAVRLASLSSRFGAVRRAEQRGSSLILAMAIMVIGTLSVVAMMSYATVSLRSAEAYQRSTVGMQAASDAVDLAITQIRGTRALGAIGGTESVTVDYDSAQAVCTAEAGSGVPNPAGGYADRMLRCTGSYSGNELLRTKVQLLDNNGEEPGAVAQVLERRVGS